MQSDVVSTTEEHKEVIVGKKYRLERLIASGGFGDVYLGTNIISGDNVAIKMESPQKQKSSLVLDEWKIYDVIRGGGTLLSCIYFIFNL
jgi:serine/threonine protein kinase